MRAMQRINDRLQQDRGVAKLKRISKLFEKPYNH